MNTNRGVLTLSGADLGTRPGDDFFRYSNGGWFDHAVIAPDHDTNSIDTFLSDIAEARIRDILMSGATSVEPSAREDATKIGVFYSNFMDEARAEALDAHPIAPFMRMLRRAETRADLAELILGRSSVRSLAFRLASTPKRQTNTPS